LHQGTSGNGYCDKYCNYEYYYYDGGDYYYDGGGNKNLYKNNKLMNDKLINNNKFVFSDKNMNYYIKNNLEKSGWLCDNAHSYIHFSFVDKYKKNTHGGDFHFDNMHYHENYQNPIIKENVSLVGEIKLLGNEFSNKKKLMHHFEKKKFFPKWEKGDISILKGDTISIETESPTKGLNDTISKYITNPLLYDKHKFNLQVYIAMYVQDDKLIQAFINPNYNMQVALQPYVEKDYSNKNIHISNNVDNNLSNIELNKREKFLSKLLKNKDIKKQVYHIIHECEIITKHFINKLKIHAIAAFELLTLDILIDEDYKVWLLDMHRTQEKELGNMHRTQENMQTKTGGKLGENISLHNFFEKYWSWVLKNVIFGNFGLHTSVWGIYNILPVLEHELWHSGNDHHQIIDYYKLPKVVVHQLILQPLHLASEHELIELSHFGVLKNVYQYISYGSKKWDLTYIKKIYNESVGDSNMHYRDYYHWLIIYDNHCVGYFGIRPDIDNKISACASKNNVKIDQPTEINCYQIRYFVSPSYQGKKLASVGGRHIVHFFKSIYPNKFLYAHVSKNNIPSIKTAESIGFHNLKIVDVHDNFIMSI